MTIVKHIVEKVLQKLKGQPENVNDQFKKGKSLKINARQRKVVLSGVEVIHYWLYY